MTTKSIDQDGVILTISFKNEVGQLHRERGRPAIIRYEDDRTAYEYYVNGVRVRPRLKGRDQPNIVVIKSNLNIYKYVNEDEKRNPSNDRPYHICLATNGEYLMRYRDRTIIGSPEFKYIETREGRFITEYSLNYNGLGAYIMDRSYNTIIVSPEQAKVHIPYIPPLDILIGTPLSYFIV